MQNAKCRMQNCDRDYDERYTRLRPLSRATLGMTRRVGCRLSARYDKRVRYIELSYRIEDLATLRGKQSADRHAWSVSL